MRLSGCVIFCECGRRPLVNGVADFARKAFTTKLIDAAEIEGRLTQWRAIHDRQKAALMDAAEEIDRLQAIADTMPERCRFCDLAKKLLLLR
jgi:hypothetical protein